jgi:hypothetical protein
VLTVALLEDAFVFSLQTFQEELVVLFSFPDVKGALTPTVTVALVYAAPTIWRIKISTLTHKNLTHNNIDAELDFYLSILDHRLIFHHLTSNISESVLWVPNNSVEIWVQI